MGGKRGCFSSCASSLAAVGFFCVGDESSLFLLNEPKYQFFRTTGRAAPCLPPTPAFPNLPQQHLALQPPEPAASLHTSHQNLIYCSSTHCCWPPVAWACIKYGCSSCYHCFECTAPTLSVILREAGQWRWGANGLWFDEMYFGGSPDCHCQPVELEKDFAEITALQMGLVGILNLEWWFPNDLLGAVFVAQ